MWAWLAISLLVSALSAWAHLRIGLSSDTLLLTRQIQLVIDGREPYVDVSEINPPLSYLFFIPPVLLSNISGLPVMTSVNLSTLLWIAASLWMTHRILQRGTNAAGRWLALSILAPALLAVSFIHQAFGDRDHLLTVLLVPWLVLYSPLVRRENIPRRWRYLSSVMAGFAFALKPYALGFYLAAMAWRLVSGASWRSLLREAEHYIIAAVIAGYLAAVALWFPIYISVILPIGMDAYRVLGWPLESRLDIIRQELLGRYAAVGLAALLAGWAWNRRRDLLGAYLLFLLAGALTGYAASGGWYYAQYPSIAAAFTLSATACLSLVATCARKARLFAPILALLLAAWLTHAYAVPALHRADWDMHLQRSRGHPLSTLEIRPPAAASIARHLDKRPEFLLLSTNVWGVTLMADDPRRNHVGRFDYLWTLPGTLLLRSDPSKHERYTLLADYLVNGVTEDLERYRPGLVIIDKSPLRRGVPPDFDILDMLKQSARFAQAWKNYRLEERINACVETARDRCAYDVYYRG